MRTIKVNMNQYIEASYVKLPIEPSIAGAPMVTGHTPCYRMNGDYYHQIELIDDNTVDCMNIVTGEIVRLQVNI